MQTAVAHLELPWRGRLSRRTGEGLSLWLLSAGLVLYLGIDGGGYDTVVHSQAAVVIWWILLLGAAWGILPRQRVGRAGRAAIALFGGFVAWSALATTWSASTERSLSSISLVAGYLGVLVLGLALMPEREAALRHVTGAVAGAITFIAALAVASRLRPDLFPAAHQTAAFLPGTQGRLAWPLNYWNALACLMAIGLPLVWAQATSVRSLRWQAAAGGALPLLVLCAYLTFSRGGAIAVGAGSVVYLALTSDRLAALAPGLLGSAGGAILIVGARHRGALEHGLSNAAARHQGQSLLLVILIVCGAAATAQYGIGLLARHAGRAAVLVVPRRRASWLTAGAAVALVLIAVAAGVPHRLGHAWQDFKRPTATGLSVDSLSRFGKTSGNGRYDYWKVGVNASSAHLLGGRGPGTFQLTWLPRAPYESYVQNAHSLYVETLSEVGIVGLVLLVGFFALGIGGGVLVVARGRFEGRVRAAGAAAAMVAFCVSAASDWVWQVPVLPACFALLCAATLSRRRTQPDAEVRTVRSAFPVRIGAVVLAAACLVAIAVPLATTTSLRQSQQAAQVGNDARALQSAQQAARLLPVAASAQLQVALVQEARHDIPAAVAAARHATRDEPGSWTTWLVLSRLQAESGQSAGSLASYQRARALNPRSPLFTAA